MSQSKRTMDKLRREIGSDYDRFAYRLEQELERRTPKRSGFAANGWHQTATKLSELIDTGRSAVFLRNDVPYIQRLDEGWSSQAPEGFVDQAIKATRKP